MLASYSEPRSIQHEPSPAAMSDLVWCEADELAAKTKEIADRLAKGPTVAYRYMKENFARAISSGDVDDCLDLEATHHVHCGQTEDHRNATKAFVEKKEPVFQGR